MHYASVVYMFIHEGVMRDHVSDHRHHVDVDDMVYHVIWPLYGRYVAAIAAPRNDGTTEFIFQIFVSVRFYKVLCWLRALKCRPS